MVVLCFGYLHGVFLSDGQALFLIGTIFLVVGNPRLNTLLHPVGLNPGILLDVFLAGKGTLQVCSILHLLHFFRSNLLACLLRFLHFVKGITFLLVNGGKIILIFFVGKRLPLFVAFLHDGDAGGFYLLLDTNAGIGKFSCIIMFPVGGIFLICLLLNSSIFQLFSRLYQFGIISFRIGLCIFFCCFLYRFLFLNICIPYCFCL